jgi:GTP cyclohydrolase II
MLRALDVHRCRILTNNPDKVKQLRDGGIDVVSSVPTGVFLTKHNHNYLRSKVSKSSHTIKL